MVNELTVVVLAAGGGTRMKSKTMKVLHPIGGRSMVGHVLAAVQEVGPDRVVAVVGHQRDAGGRAHPGARARRRARGAGDPGRHRARRAGGRRGRRYRRAAPCSSRPATPRCCAGRACGSSPADHAASGRAVSILTGVVDDPFGYGRIVRDPDGRRRRDRRGEGRRRRAAGDPRDQQRDPGLRRGVPRRRAAAPHQRQRQGRVLPDRHRRAGPRGRPRRRGARARRRAPDRGRQRPRPARRPRPRAQPPDPRRAGCATASP